MAVYLAAVWYRDVSRDCDPVWGIAVQKHRMPAPNEKYGSGVSDSIQFGEGWHPLLLVRLAHGRGVPLRRDRLVGRERHAGRVLRLHMGVVAERGEGRGDDSLRQALVADRGYVVDAKAALAFGHEHVFAAQLQAAGGAVRVLDDIGELLQGLRLTAEITVEGFAAGPFDQLAIVALDVEAPIIGVGVAVEVGAEHRLRLLPFGDPDRLEAVLHPDPGVEADEVHEIGTLEQQLRHDGVVVVRLAQMAVGAGLGLGLAHRVREMGREGLARKTDGADRRLLDVDALAVEVG